jgi:hypothetical protein
MAFRRLAPRLTGLSVSWSPNALWCESVVSLYPGCCLAPPRAMLGICSSFWLPLVPTPLPGRPVARASSRDPASAKTTVSCGVRSS